MIKVEKNIEDRVCQGDVFKDIEYIEYATEKAGTFEISKIIFPFAIVLTQDCDLQQDFTNKKNGETKNQDKYLFSVILAPLYNIEHLYQGTHLSELELKMQLIDKNSTQGKYLKQNQLPRYHYLEFDETVQIPPIAIDFKHYFSVNVELLLKTKEKNFICKVSPLYRENISLRFANFLSRIGLP